jgi:hypothetical protein
MKQCTTSSHATAVLRCHNCCKLTAATAGSADAAKTLFTDNARHGSSRSTSRTCGAQRAFTYAAAAICERHDAACISLQRPSNRTHIWCTAVCCEVPVSTRDSSLLQTVESQQQHQLETSALLASMFLHRAGLVCWAADGCISPSAQQYPHSVCYAAAVQ